MVLVLLPPNKPGVSVARYRRKPNRYRTSKKKNTTLEAVYAKERATSYDSGTTVTSDGTPMIMMAGKGRGPGRLLLFLVGAAGWF